jgi:hypothetical protein
LALLNNPEANAKVLALYGEILRIVDDERNQMSATGCNICGSDDRVRPVFERENSPCLCRYHRVGWGVASNRHRYHDSLPLDLHFAKWLASTLLKGARNATQ